MELEKAKSIAERVKHDLAPYCKRIEIAGSIRREKPEQDLFDLIGIEMPHPSERNI